jgi:hypothetical protein
MDREEVAPEHKKRFKKTRKRNLPNDSSKDGSKEHFKDAFQITRKSEHKKQKEENIKVMNIFELNKDKEAKIIQQRVTSQEGNSDIGMTS